MSRRILDEVGKSTFASDDYLYMDSATEGASKITPDNLVRNTTVAQQLAQHIADAEDDVEQITSDIEDIQTDINDVKADLGDLSDLDTTDKSSIVGAINEVAGGSGSGVPTTVRSAMLALFEAAAYAETGLTDEIAVIESWAEEVTDITLNSSTISISGSGTSQLTATTVPSGATVSWSSSNTAVATVSSSGLVTGVSNGTATITASAGDMSATCTVTVSGFVTLTSISAVYTQSGTVYDTDTLDSLRTDLVVTGTYDDSSTETITTYTLSGTLSAGTSTITVAYGGKTATFNVNVSMSRTTRFGTFVNGHAVSKAANAAGDVPQNGTYISSLSARAAFSTPIVNNGYTFTVTDSSKYNLAVYDITDNTPISATYSAAIEGVYYTGGSKSISWKTTDSATTPYILVALKKMDNTAFTDAELANGAEAVFTFTES